MACDMTEADIRRTLKDSGCSPALIQRFIKTWEAGEIHDCSRLLDSYRRTLLDDIHVREEKLTCLDYLRYQLKKT